MRRPLLSFLAAVAVASCSGDVSGPASGGNTPVFLALSAGGAHACAVATDGAAYCWGNGSDGELGQGQKLSSSTPVRVVGNVLFRTITAGDSHTCGLAQDSTAWCWGWNVYYQRGNAVDPAEAAPVQVTGKRAFASIEAGSQHTCALTADGRAFCWGYNRFGQLGEGTTNTSIEPQAVLGGLRFRQISAGWMHSCAVATDGRAYCWGSNSQGQLGSPIDSTLNARVPLPVQGATRFTAVSAGYNHSCGVGTDGNAYCWGGNEYGQLGDGSYYRSGLPAVTTPERVAGASGFSTVSAGTYYTCGTSAGLGRCWGHGLDGQLGNGNTLDEFLPQTVHLQPTGGNGSDLLQFQSMAGGPARYACGLSIDGAGYCWGTGDLGNGENAFSTLPVRVDIR